MEKGKRANHTKDITNALRQTYGWIGKEAFSEKTIIPRRYWKKIYSDGVIEIRVQRDCEFGNSLLIAKRPAPAWKSYKPLSAMEHRRLGYVEISMDEAKVLAEKAGRDLKTEKD